MSERFMLSRRKGWRMPEGGVSCARPSRYGNPWALERSTAPWHHATPWFVINRDLHQTFGPFDRICAVAVAVAWFKRETLPTWPDEWRAELAGRPLGCYCPLDRLCHVDAIIEWANP